MVEVSITNRGDYVVALGEGVIDSAVDFARYGWRFDKIAMGLGYMVYYAFETIAITEAMLEDPNQDNLVHWQNRVDKIAEGLSYLQKEFYSLDGPGRVRALTRFGVDFYIPGKMIKAAGRILGGIYHEAKNLRSLENAIVMTEHGGLIEESLQKIIELEEAVGNNALTEFVEAEANFARAGQFINKARAFGVIVEELKPVIEQVKRLGGVIPFENITLRNQFKSLLAELEACMQHHELQKLIKNQGSKVIDGKRVNIILKHVLGFELKLKDMKSVGGYIFKIEGGHLFGCCEKLEKSGLVKIVNQKTYSNGVVDYILQCVVSGKEYPKTVCPAHWTAEKIIKSIWEIYENSIRDDVVSKNNRHFVRRGIVEGIDMEIILDPINNNQVKENIISLLPYVKG